MDETKPEPGNVLDYFTYFHTPDENHFKKTMAEIKDSQSQFWDGLISAQELETQIRRAEEKYFKQKYWNVTCDKLKAKLIKEIK